MSKTKITRREERETVFKLLFSASFRPDEDPSDILREYEEDNEKTCSEYIRNTFFGALSSIGDSDVRIEADSKNWKASRLSSVTSSLLRLSIYEMLNTDVPPKVAINEAVELAKQYGGDESPSFVNGILGEIAREL